jgi:hypothetical protein
MLERVHHELTKVNNSRDRTSEINLNNRRSLGRLREPLRSITTPFTSPHCGNPTTSPRDQLAELVCAGQGTFLSGGGINGELIGNFWGIVHERTDGNGLLDAEGFASDE